MASVAIAASSSGNNEIVAAVAGKSVRVHGYVLVANGDVDAKFRSADAADLTGAMPMGAKGGGVAAPWAGEAGWFQTAAGEALNLNLSGAVAVRGHLVYTLK